MTQAEMVWIDFETSGLSALENIPLEVGLTVTDRFGTIIDQYATLVVYPGWRFFWAAAPDAVIQMHTKSGLTAELEEASNLTVENPKKYVPSKVDQEIYEWLTLQHRLEPNVFPMCGSTVNFDRDYVQKYFPQLNKFFHYRNIDVSTIKNLCKLLNPELYDRKPESPEKEHRVLADIEASIEEYKFYLDNFLFVAGALPSSLRIS